MRGGQDGSFSICTHMVVPAGKTRLPCGLHLREGTFLASRLLSEQMQMCYNVTSEFLSLLEYLLRVVAAGTFVLLHLCVRQARCISSGSCI
jgi:hypothetical protein